MNDGDLEAYMATIDEQSSLYDSTRQLVETLFSTYALNCELQSIEIIDITDDSAKVKVVQLTEKVSGPGFRDNILTATHSLRKRNGYWKLYDTQVDKIEYLN